MDNLDKTENYTVRDMSLAEQGALRVDWARARMPVMAKLKEEAERTKPLAGMRVAGCLHVTKETAVLIVTHFRPKMMSPLGLHPKGTLSTLGTDNPTTISIGALTELSNSNQPSLLTTGQI